MNMTRVDALAHIMDLREDIADFLARHDNAVDSLIEDCDEGGWNESVAYELRDGLCKLGFVLATLSLWERDASIPPEEVRQAEEIHKTPEE